MKITVTTTTTQASVRSIAADGDLDTVKTQAAADDVMRQITEGMNDGHTYAATKLGGGWLIGTIDKPQGWTLVGRFRESATKVTKFSRALSLAFHDFAIVDCTPL